MSIDHNTDYILEDERVIMKPLRSEDISLLMSFAIDEPEIWQYSLTSGAGPSEMENYIRLAMEGKSSGKEYPWIVFDKKLEKYAGSTRFYDIQPSNKSTQLGFTWYGKEFRGTGLNKHCKYLLLRFAFETHNLERVEFRADYRNKTSIEAMKSIGCIEEGILRSHGITPQGERRDSIVLSILKEEWFNNVKPALENKIY